MSLADASYKVPTGPERELEIWQMWCRIHPIPSPRTIQEAKAALVATAMEFAGGNKSLASRVTGVSYPNLCKHLKRMGWR